MSPVDPKLIPYARLKAHSAPVCPHNLKRPVADPHPVGDPQFVAVVAAREGFAFGRGVGDCADALKRCRAGRAGYVDARGRCRFARLKDQTVDGAGGPRVGRRRLKRLPVLSLRVVGVMASPAAFAV